MRSVLRATWRFFGGVEPLVKNGCAWHTRQKKSVVYNFHWYCDGWINFWSLSKFKNSHVIPYSKNSSLKRTFGFRNQTFAQPKISEKNCFGYLTKPLALRNFRFCLFIFRQEKPHVDPKNIALQMGRYVYVRFLGNQTATTHWDAYTEDNWYIPGADHF